METIKCIKERRSIRRFTEKQVDTALIEEIISVASYAPSWKNTQISRYTVIKNQEIKNAIAKDGVLGFSWNQGNIESCPVLVVQSYKNGICGFEPDGSFSTAKGDRWQMFDAGIAAQTFCLAAHDKGLSTLIMGVIDEKYIAEKINLPKDETIASLIAIGYPAQEPVAPPRKSVEEITRTI